MSTPTTLQTWIVEALVSLGGSGGPLDVSRQLWTRRRAELEESGDLLYTWQVELRTTAETMIASGLLSSVDGAWVVADSARAAAVGPGGWTDEEIVVAVDAYVSLLRDRDEGRPLRRQEAAAQVRDRTGRTAAAVDALFANVSAVVQELGIDYLTAYPPRSNVPRGVRQAVRTAVADDA